MQIVDALEGLPPVAPEDGADGARRRIELHDAMAIIRDEDAAVLVDLQAIGLAVILGRQCDHAIGRDPEDPPPGHVDDIENSRPGRRMALPGSNPSRWPPRTASIQCDVRPEIRYLSGILAKTSVWIGGGGENMKPSFSARGIPGDFERATAAGDATAAVPCSLE